MAGDVALNAGAPPSAAAHFSHTYREARERFVAVATAVGLGVEGHLHPLRGRDGETLALDVVRDGPLDAAAVLVVSSACHGVEGFCGSGVQTALLHDAVWRDAVRASDVAVLYLHALNPHGFSWWRRTTHENVDLNRNFRDFAEPLPRNAGYDELAAHLVPADWPPPAAAEAALERFRAEHGMAAFQQAVSGGQYDHPHGLFYGGREPTWSNRTLRRVLRDHGRGCARLGWIDLHTGLGPAGVGERIFAGRNDREALRRARSWWGERVTSIVDGSSSSAPLEGLMWLAAGDECLQADHTGIALEFGTVPLLQMFDALRASQWLELHPQAGAALRRRIERQTRDAFHIDTDAWKQQVVDQARDAARGALAGLAAGR